MDAAADDRLESLNALVGEWTIEVAYGVSFGDGVWRMWRDAPGFSQRFAGTFSDDGDTIEGLWKLSLSRRHASLSPE